MWLEDNLVANIGIIVFNNKVFVICCNTRFILS